ncbi:DUF6361 family protein [Phycicoccus sp. DTK01]|uniref:DUF6361 family protein n=1 Tax=Phycicoccus sp. DTK01 TaxID=2785745 RepID=UPI001A8D8F43|nr:DUF6361 family protein [Phycicoccus sp. DTK01]GIL34006.1 hypothetical protein PDTK01_00830 [Phycicoccus sp. DTK01]
MTSAFAWLDNDDAQQRQMNELLELFKEDSTVDELGIGTIRDTFANELFPGTSVLQTRARYFLFTGWLMRDVMRQGLTGDDAVARLRADEVRLITALLNGGELAGVIGNRARHRLKRMPSEAYWAGMGRFGLRTWDLSISAHLRSGSARALITSQDPDEIGHEATQNGLDRALPPAPDGLLRESSFDLRPEDAAYLTDRIAAACPTSLLAWLALHEDDVSIDYVWQHPAAAQFPEHARHLVDHARRFHHAIFGSALLYNLLVAEKRGDAQLVDAFREYLDDWEDEIRSEQVFDGWDCTHLWSTLTRLNPRLRVATRMFVDAWLDRAQQRHVADDASARDLVRDREVRIKGGRARLANPAALETWSEAAGLARLDYRWGVASRHLDDIYAARRIR